jgi:hypothetical protein
MLLHLQVGSILLFVRGCTQSDLQPAALNFFPLAVVETIASISERRVGPNSSSTLITAANPPHRADWGSHAIISGEKPLDRLALFLSSRSTFWGGDYRLGRWIVSAQKMAPPGGSAVTRAAVRSD